MMAAYAVATHKSNKKIVALLCVSGALALMADLYFTYHEWPPFNFADVHHETWIILLLVVAFGLTVW